MISKATKLVLHPIFRTGFFLIVTRIKADFTFLNGTSNKGFTSAFNIIDATQSYTFVLPNRSKCSPVSLLKATISVSRSVRYSCTIIIHDEGINLTKLVDFMITLHDLHMIVETTGGYESTINGKLELPNWKFKNMLHSQLISRFHNEKLWCFFYQYSGWLVRRLINKRIGNVPIISWFKVKYKIKLW